MRCEVCFLLVVSAGVCISQRRIQAKHSSLLWPPQEPVKVRHQPDRLQMVRRFLGYPQSHFHVDLHPKGDYHARKRAVEQPEPKMKPTKLEDTSKKGDLSKQDTVIMKGRLGKKDRLGKNGAVESVPKSDAKEGSSEQAEKPLPIRKPLQKGPKKKKKPHRKHKSHHKKKKYRRRNGKWEDIVDLCIKIKMGLLRRLSPELERMAKPLALAVRYFLKLGIRAIKVNARRIETAICRSPLRSILKPLIKLVKIKMALKRVLLYGLLRSLSNFLDQNFRKRVQTCPEGSNSGEESRAVEPSVRCGDSECPEFLLSSKNITSSEMLSNTDEESESRSYLEFAFIRKDI